ncbi:MAG: T9SS type A sorting domain-containing protein [Bacteroidetes bacterium]|nr:T9SS type A sorting domain-containing protein [Bacteroidota bacterium]
MKTIRTLLVASALFTGAAYAQAVSSIAHSSAFASVTGDSSITINLPSGGKGHFETISMVGHTSTFASSGVSITLNLPANSKANDLLLVQISGRLTSGSVMTGPAGWKRLYSLPDISNQFGTNVFYKIQSATEPTSFTFTDSTGTSITDKLGVISAYHGVDITTPINAMAATIIAGTYTSPSVTTTSDSCMIVGLFSSNSLGLWTAPSGMKSRYDTSATQSTFVSIMGSDSVKTKAGNVAQLTATHAGTNGAVVMIALKPAFVITSDQYPVANDLLLAQISGRITAKAAVIPPAGWIKVRSLSSIPNQHATFIFYKIAGASEPATYTFKDSAKNVFSDRLGAITVYRGVDVSSPINAEDGVVTSSSPYSTPAVTTTVDSCLLVTLYSSATSGTWTVSSGRSVEYDTTGAQSSFVSIMSADSTQLIAGSVGTLSASQANASGTAAVIALQPKMILTGITTISGSSGFNIYPNPCNGQFNVSLGNNSPKSKFEVYNLLGEVVYGSQLNYFKNVINLDSQIKGIYFYRIIASEGAQILSTGRIIVQ